tara:strand:- start:4379 stop:4864 length:486 start_codon:yes stop_codon:yes gene_type:complete
MPYNLRLDMFGDDVSPEIRTQLEELGHVEKQIASLKAELSDMEDARRNFIQNQLVDVSALDLLMDGMKGAKKLDSYFAGKYSPTVTDLRRGAKLRWETIQKEAEGKDLANPTSEEQALKKRLDELTEAQYKLGGLLTRIIHHRSEINSSVDQVIREVWSKP